jgi:hypothetical protein
VGFKDAEMTMKVAKVPAPPGLKVQGLFEALSDDDGDDDGEFARKRHARNLSGTF